MAQKKAHLIASVGPSMFFLLWLVARDEDELLMHPAGSVSSNPNESSRPSIGTSTMKSSHHYLTRVRVPPN